MSIEAAQVSVGTSPVSLADGGSNGVSVLVQNVSATTALLGGSATMGTLTGAQLLGTAALGWYVGQGESLYAVTASGTASLHVLRGGV